MLLRANSRALIHHGGAGSWTIDTRSTATGTPSSAAKSRYHREMLCPKTTWCSSQVLRTTFLRDFRDLSQYSQQVLVFPPRQEAATVDALSFTFFLGLEQTQRHLAQPGKVLRTIAGPMSLLVLAETDIQHPVQRILDPPMSAHRLEILLCRPVDTPDVIADLTAADAVDFAIAQNHADRGQVDPQPRVPDATRVFDNTTCARLVPRAMDLFSVTLGEVDPGLAFIQGLVKRFLDILIEMRLVLLHGQQVLTTPLVDPCGDVFLTAHGINRHDGSPEIQKLQQLGNRRDFVRFRVSRDLAQRQVILHRPGAHHVKGGLTDGATSRTTLGLPIDGNRPQCRLI